MSKMSEIMDKVFAPDIKCWICNGLVIGVWPMTFAGSSYLFKHAGSVLGCDYDQAFGIRSAGLTIESEDHEIL